MDLIEEQRENNGHRKAEQQCLKLSIRVFLIAVVEILVEKNCLKYLNSGSAQGLPRMPWVILKSLNAMSEPYIGEYINTASQMSAGSSKV